MSRTVRTRECPHCRAVVLAGLDRDWLALDTTLDAQPVDNLGEALALIQGRRTFDLRPTRSHGSHGRLMEERNAWRISNPWQLPYPVHAEHRCGQPLPAAPPPTPTAASGADEHIDEGAPF